VDSNEEDSVGVIEVDSVEADVEASKADHQGVDMAGEWLLQKVL
jgi:hypothetical protein